MDFIEFFREVGRLKAVKRKGWVIDGVKDPESVADHSFFVSLMTLVFGWERKDIDLLKALKMALIHDISESKTGDIVIWGKWYYDRSAHKKEMFDNVTKEEKMEIETKAFSEISELMGEHGKEYFELWKELESGNSKEAGFVRSIDKLELAFQVLEYSWKYPGKNLNHYMEFCKEKVIDPELHKIVLKIEEMMPKNNKKRKR